MSTHAAASLTHYYTADIHWYDDNGRGHVCSIDSPRSFNMKTQRAEDMLHLFLTAKRPAVEHGWTIINLRLAGSYRECTEGYFYREVKLTREVKYVR